MLALLLALVVPSDTLLVDVQLVGVDHVVVEAILTQPDSVLLLPAADVHQLLGLPPPTSQWLTVAALKRSFPPLSVEWMPRALLVVIRDDLLALPASRQTRDALINQARGGSPFSQIASGPFLALTTDGLGRTLVDGGYNWRGQISLTARHSSTRGAAWTLSLAPVPSVFVSYSGGHSMRDAVSARIAKGPLWLQPVWSAADHRLQTDGLLSVGWVKLFASTRKTFLLSIQGRGADLQLGRSAGVWASRVSIGPIPASPFGPLGIP